MTGQRLLHQRIIEGCQSEHRPAPDGDPILERGQNRGEPGGITDGAEGRYRGLPAQRIRMRAHQHIQGLNRPLGWWLTLPGSPGCDFCDRGVGVAQQANHQGPDIGWVLGARSELSDPAPHGAVRVGSGPMQIVDGECPQPVQRPQAGHPNLGVRVDQGGSGCVVVAPVTGQHHGPHPVGAP